MKKPHPLNIIFAGTPVFAEIVLAKLLSEQQPITAVYTQPDKPAGRGRRLTASPVKQLAQNHHLPILQPTTLRDDAAAHQLTQLAADLMVVVAYGMILPANILAIPKFGCINVHPSLLPAWRGSTPIQQAILAGDEQTGITIMQMNERLDAGDIIQQSITPILATDTSGGLHQQLAEKSGEMLTSLLKNLALGHHWDSHAQDDSQATFSSKITKECTVLNWQLTAIELDRHIRAFYPAPGAMSYCQQQLIKIWRANPKPIEHHATPGTIVAVSQHSIDVATGKGLLQIQELQLAGSKSLPVSAVLNSRRELFAPGNQFSSASGEE